MATRLVYKTNSGEIKAIVDDPNHNIEKIMSNWTDVDWIQTDMMITFDLLKYVRVNPQTRQVERI